MASRACSCSCSGSTLFTYLGDHKYHGCIAVICFSVAVSLPKSRGEKDRGKDRERGGDVERERDEAIKMILSRQKSCERHKVGVPAKICTFF